MKDEKKIAQKENLLRKKKVLLQAHQSNKKKIEIQLTQEKRSLKHLIHEKKDYANQLNSKSSQLRDKTQEIADLIERAKKTSDKQTIEILMKWEQSNQKLMDKYSTSEEAQGEDEEVERVVKEIPEPSPKSDSEEDTPQHEELHNDIATDTINEEELEESTTKFPPKEKSMSPEPVKRKSPMMTKPSMKREEPEEQEEEAEKKPSPVTSKPSFGKPSFDSAGRSSMAKPNFMTKNTNSHKPMSGSYVPSLTSNEDEKKSEALSFSDRHKVASSKDKTFKASPTPID